MKLYLHKMYTYQLTQSQYLSISYKFYDESSVDLIVAGKTSNDD